MRNPFRRGTGRLTPAEARTRTGTPGGAVLLDVREVSEWNAGHAPGAVHLPLTRLLAGAALPGTVEGRPVVAVCRSGHRSRQAAKLLAGRGVDALDVEGGMIAWERAGLPVTGGRGRGGSTA
ncbi:rhodanese-like domain-containing protein [Streptomyces halstedii]|uniref:rhodanese-like domain-containing protein n=1 Tax=Streptomyces halstedii TaxID=1944 RepID=UPI0037F177CB